MTSAGASFDTVDGAERVIGRIVDVHAHAFLPEVETVVAGRPGLAAVRALDARRAGVESTAVSEEMVAARIVQLTNLNRRLADMDSAGIDVQVVSPSPSHYHYWTEAVLASTVAAIANRAVASLVAGAPSRLVGLGLVPLHHPHLLVDSLNDAVLGCGLAGVEISSFAPGVELSNELLEPFWARAEELDAVVFVHPFGCSLDERLDRFYLSNTVGQPVENAVALSHIIFAGVLDRYPNLKLLAAHGGGYLPTSVGRSDHAWKVRPDARRCADPPSSYLTRISFDSLVHGRAALRSLVDAVGAGSVVLGSDYPFDMGSEDPVGEVRGAGLPREVERALLSDNASRLGLAIASDGPELADGQGGGSTP